MIDDVFKDYFGLSEEQMKVVEKNAAEMRAVDDFSRQQMLKAAVEGLRQQGALVMRVVNELSEVALTPEEAVNFYQKIQEILKVSQKWISSKEVRKLRGISPS